MTIHKNPLVKPFVKWAGGKATIITRNKTLFAVKD